MVTALIVGVEYVIYYYPAVRAVKLEALVLGDSNYLESLGHLFLIAGDE